MAQSFIEKQHTQLIKKFHVLLGKCKIGSEGKSEILAAYGVDSSKNLTHNDLYEICQKLTELSDPRIAELDKLRKQLMASIGAWLRGMNMQQNADIIKGIACRASGYKYFNQIPKERLRSLYYAFTKKSKDLHSVDELTAEMLQYLGQNN